MSQQLLSFKTNCRFCQKARLLLVVLLTTVAIFFALVKLPQWVEKTDKSVNQSNNMFLVEKAESSLQDDHYYLDATLSMHFSPEVIEALENGVSLTITIELKIIEKNSWFDKVIKESVQNFEIRYYALTNLHSIKNLVTQKEFFFNSREDVLEQLGKIRHAHLINTDELNNNKHHQVQLRVFVDIWRLPEVLRPVASLSPAWYLKSNWYNWMLN